MADGKLAGGVGGQGAGVPEDGITSRQYAFLVFLTTLNVLNFVDRQLLASFANFIIPDLNLTNTEFGLLTGLLFIVFYATMGLFAGALADLVHRPRLVAAGLALWSVFTALSGAARGFVSLAVPRMLIGIGESVLTPASMSMLADRFPAHRLGFAAGFYYMGVPLGVGASLLVAGYLGPAIGWRNCFYLLGAIGLVFAVILLFIKETPRTAHAAGLGGSLPTDGNGGERMRLGQIVRLLGDTLSKSPALALTMAGGVTAHFVLGAAAFDQVWLVKERGFDRAEIAQISGFLALIGGVSGNLAGGLLSDLWQRVTGTGRPLFLCWTFLLLAPVGIAFRLMDPSSIWFYIFYGMAFFQLGVFYGPTFATVQELVPARIRSTVVAFYILLLNVVGLGVGITASGIVIDLLQANGVEQPLTATLVVFTGLSGLSIPMFYFAGSRFEKDRARLLGA